MSKFTPDDTIDALLDKIATATLQSITSDTSTPTDLTNTIASVSMASGDYTIANGDTSGRKVTIAQKTGVSITLAGTNTARHVVLSLSGTILDVTTCVEQPLTFGGTVTIGSWAHEVADPT